MGLRDFFKRGGASPVAAVNNLANVPNSQNLRKALTNYITAVNALNKNSKNNAHIYGVLMKSKNGTNTSYKNRIVNGVAKVVIAARRAEAATAAHAVGLVPAAPAVAAVNNATANVNKLSAELKVKPTATGAPLPVGLGGLLHGVTRGERNNSNASRSNRTTVNSILANSSLNSNNKKIAALIASNPKVKYAGLITNSNTENFKRLMTAVNAQLNKNGRNGANGLLNKNLNNGAGFAGNMFVTPVTPREKLNAALANTTNQKLQANITNRTKANALLARVRKAAVNAQVNLKNKNVNAALNRIVAHQSRFLN